MQPKNDSLAPLLRMEYDDGILHFFNYLQISDILICKENVQITTSTRETFAFPLELNRDGIEGYLKQEIHCSP